MPSRKNPLGNHRILVAPLDWGLGHATRCIPVIYELIAQNVEVWLAGEGTQEAILRKEFPSLPFLSLTGYRVKYGRSAFGLIKNLIVQWPALLRSISREHKWLEQMINEYHFDAVISDNRFGLHHHSVPCIFMTHQLSVKSPFGKWTSSLLQRYNYRFINRFTACWVPDNEKGNDLAGDLSHPKNLPAIPVSFTGFLSRLKHSELPEKKGHLFISLSGPEPQRSLLEDKLVNQLSHYNGTAVIVRGLPDASRLIPSTNDIHFYNHLPTNQYEQEMAKAQYVISRSGYSTVMDLAVMEKKSILIATPGQTEQEYLSRYLAERKIALCIDQGEFKLVEALNMAANFPYCKLEDSVNKLSATIADFLSTLKAG
jgi:hypothetical protein